MSAFVVIHVVGNGSVVPVPFESARFAHLQTSPITCAGLPITRDLGGTSRVTIAPGSMNEPAPTRTPLRIVAPGPTQTASSMMTGLPLISGLERPSLKVEQAIASAIRSAGSIG